jgi:methionyl-tRNA formyltransferase
MAPSPGAFALLADEPLRILAACSDPEPTRVSPGTLLRDARGRVRIATGAGWLVPLRVQRAGGRSMEIEAFLRGRPLADGTRFVVEPLAGEER